MTGFLYKQFNDAGFAGVTLFGTAGVVTLFAATAAAPATAASPINATFAFLGSLEIELGYLQQYG